MKKIQWNKVTWYSKLVAAVLFVFVFFFAFHLGTEYEKAAVYLNENSVSISPALPADMTLGSGQTARVGDLFVTFNSLVQDSRCPTDVYCIQVGVVTVNITFRSGSHTVTKNISLDEAPQDFAGYELSIVSVTPKAQSKKQISLKDYRVMFRVAM